MLSRRNLVLLAWEGGSGLGHINRLIAVARELAQYECTFVFALRSLKDQHVVTGVLPDALIREAPARRIAQMSVAREARYSYADMLFRIGYSSMPELQGMVAAWQRFIRDLAPTLIICDHSPTVLLAVGGDIPVIHIGSGFANPPPGRQLFPLDPTAFRGAEERQARVLKNICDIRRQQAKPPPQFVSDIFYWATTFPCTLPELDPYRVTRSSPAIGSIQRLPQPAPLPPDCRKLFGYLTYDDGRVIPLIESISRARIPSIIYLRNAPASWLPPNCTTVRLVREPTPIETALLEASAILHHGGVGTAEMALAIGRPQLLLPRHCEQGLTAEAIQKMGCGTILTCERRDLGREILNAIRDDMYVTDALRVAISIGGRPSVDVKAKVVAACLKHLTL